MGTLPQVKFSHSGIFTTDLAKMERFYTDIMGFIASDRGVASTGHHLVFMTQDPEVHHQLVIFSGKPEDLEFNTINQMSYLLDSLEDLQTYYRLLLKHGYGPIDQVDHGNAWSMYFADPEGNPIEMFVDTPFYTPQPCREPLDLSQPAEVILHTTEKMCRTRPNFMTRDEWIEATRSRLNAERP